MSVLHIIKDAFAGVREFNDIAGNLTNVTDESVDAQIGFCFEELTEVIDAFESGDKAEILKETCDLFVVVAGLMQKLEAQGYEVDAALLRVNDNNLSKFPEYGGSGFQHETGHVVLINDKYLRYVIKDAAGKVRKPLGYRKCQVGDLVPKEAA